MTRDEAIATLREFIGPSHVYVDEAGEAYCDWCNLRTPNHRVSCRRQKALAALSVLIATGNQGAMEPASPIRSEAP